MSLLGSAGLGPDASRAEARDAVWRARLSASLLYLAQVMGEEAQTQLEAVSSRVRQGRVSPWVSCLYSKLVADLSAKDYAEASAALKALVAVSQRPSHDVDPLVLNDPSLAAPYWTQCLRLVDTDRALPFRPITPSGEAVAGMTSDIAGSMALIEELDPAAGEELRALLRVIVLASPATAHTVDDFGAVSSFFLRELVLINAERRRGTIALIDTLLHEASHVLLFGLGIEQPLTSDGGANRYRSAARSDPRPIDGIFHACFVTTRVHAGFTRLLETGRLSAGHAQEAEARRARNAFIARDTLQTLVANAKTTLAGDEVLSVLSDYWAKAPVMTAFAS